MKQMKKFAALLLAMAIILSMAACGQPEEVVETPDAVTPSVEPESYEFWEIIYSTDEFGDPVEGSDPVLRTQILGHFSNTATSASPLSGWIFLHNDENRGYTLSFRLIEYGFGHSPITFTENEAKDVSLKTKVGDSDVINEYRIGGVAPDSDLYLFDSYDEYEGNAAEEIYNALLNGDTVRCIITLGLSEYTFSIYSGNFAELCEETGI